MTVDAIGLLHEPVRRAVYEFVAAQPGPVGRDAVAEAIGVGRTLAAFPPREYRALAGILAEALEDAGADAQARAAAYRRGVGQAPGPAEDLLGHLARLGYEPVAEGRDIRLRNCPFGTVAHEFPPLVCGLNLAYIRGMLAGGGRVEDAARLDALPDGCCVAIRRDDSKDDQG